MRVANNIIFSNLDSRRSGLQQARDNSKHIFNQNVNAAKTFEQNTREINQTATTTAATKVDVDAKDNVGTTTTTSSFTQSNKKNQ
jgi:hypothetical protein